MNVFAMLGIIFLVSFMVEAIVEFALGTPMDKIEKLHPYKWLLMYVGLATGVAAAFMWQFDFVSLLSEHLAGRLIEVSPFGMVLTGLTIGRGSNAVHDLLMKIFKRE